MCPFLAGGGNTKGNLLSPSKGGLATRRWIIQAYRALSPGNMGGSLPRCVMPPFTIDFLDGYVPLAYQVSRLKMTFNSGYFARVKQRKSEVLSGVTLKD